MTSLLRPAFKLNGADRCQRCGGVQFERADEDGAFTTCLTCARVTYPVVRSESEVEALTEYSRLKAENPEYQDPIPQTRSA